MLNLLFANHQSTGVFVNLWY